MAIKTWQITFLLSLITGIYMISPCYASYWLEVSPYQANTVRMHFSGDDDALLLSDYPYALSSASDVRAFAHAHSMAITRSDSDIADEIMAHAYAWWYLPIPQVMDRANPMDLTMNSNSWFIDIAKDTLNRGIKFILD